MNKVIKKLFLYAILILFSAIFILPLVYSLYTSMLQLKDVDKFVGMSQLTLDNYKTLVKTYPIGRWYWNTIIMTAIILVGNVITNTMAGYALAKLKFKGKKLIFIIVLATMMVPYHMILIPVYIMMAKLGWLNTFAALTIPYLYQCLYVFLMRQFFGSIPDELLEAARIDGLTKAGAFFRIALPLSMPALATMLIISFTGTWNSYLIPSTFVSKESMYVLVVGLNTAKDLFFERTNLTMAGVVLTTIPVIIFFLIFQKQYVQGIATTGLKS
jgi:multiple sugar transport system permease protein